MNKKKDIKEIINFDTFNWKTYINNYTDLKDITDKKTAWEHWINHGINENRVTYNLYNTFEWINYLHNYADLKSIIDKKTAWEHWVNHGKHEKRVTYSLYEKEIEQFNQKCKENNVLFINDKTKNVILKTNYHKYGLQYFGWEKVISEFILYFLKYSFQERIQFKQLIFFDESIEKLLDCGNRIENNNYLTEINEKNCKLILTYD